MLSEATRRLDTVLKRQTYERFGVREYWLVDPHRQSIEVWALTAEGYGRGVVLRTEEGDALMPPLLPGLRIPLAEIFRPRRASRPHPQPRRGVGIKPGASAPGKQHPQTPEAPEGRRQTASEAVSCLRPFGTFGGWGRLNLALKRQALCPCPFGAYAGSQG